MAVVPFRLQYALGRRDRLAAECTPHLPALAAGLGFSFGSLYLALAASGWFLLLLALPAVVCRKLIAFLAELATVAARPVDVLVEADRFGVLAPTGRVWLDLDGVIQVFRSEDGRVWTLLHLSGFALTIPAEAVQPDQLDFLKAFALRGWRERRRLTFS